MKYLTAGEHAQVVERLIPLLSNTKGVEIHPTGIEYTSLMMCFALHFEHVIQKKTLEAIERHRTSGNSSWREGLELLYKSEYAPRKRKIDSDYANVRSQFEDKNGKRATSWSGKSLYSMPKAVDHLEAYEIFYADLSTFAHVNVMLANRFLRLQGWKGHGPLWSQRADEFDVAHVFQYAATFLTCFL
jgi:Family of unknown function (DUF5677)